MKTLGYGLITFAVLGMLLVTPGLAQEPVATPDPGAVLNRAEEVAALAEVTAQQNARTIELMRNLTWFFGILIGIAAAGLGLYGFNTQRGFQESQKEYREQLHQMQAANQAATERYQAEQARVRELAEQMAQKVSEIEEIHKDLIEIKAAVTDEFTAAKQAMVLLGMGNRLFRDGKREEAIDIYQDAQRLQPEDAQINYRLGRAYSNAGRYQEAIDALEKAVYAKPDLAEAHMELGLAYRRHAEQVPTAEERGADYRLAERFLKRAVDLHPEYGDAWAALGGLCRRDGRHQEALEYYRRAARVAPNLSYPWNNIASLSWFLGKTDEAKAAFERVAELASERIESPVSEEGFWDYYDRALAWLVLGRREEALADHRTAIQLTPEKENLRSVLDNLKFLKRSGTWIEGLDEFISMVEEESEGT